MKTKTVFIPFVRLSSVAGAVVRGPWWCCGLVVTQPPYTTTPYTIHYRGSLINFNIRTRTSYHTTILCTAAMYPVPRSGWCVYSYAPYNVAPYSVPATVSGTYSGHDCQGYRQNTETIPILVPSYTVIRCCGIPRNTETNYRYSIFWNTVKYRKNTVKIP